MRLIDADDLRKAMISLARISRDFLYVAKFIDDAPTVDAEPVKHGAWVRIGEPDQDRNISCFCSECKAGDSHAVGLHVPYCWKCGAKMDVEEGVKNESN